VDACVCVCARSLFIFKSDFLAFIPYPFTHTHTRTHSYLDVLVQREALKYQLPAAEYVVGVDNVIKAFNVDVDTINKYLHKFRAIDTEKKGVCVCMCVCM
jgi:hypothetical protein